MSVRAPFTFPEFLGHSFHFLSVGSSALSGARNAAWPFSLSFDIFFVGNHFGSLLLSFFFDFSFLFFFLTRIRIYIYILVGTYIVATIVIQPDAQWNTGSLFFLNAPMEIESRVLARSCPQRRNKTLAPAFRPHNVPHNEQPEVRSIPVLRRR